MLCIISLYLITATSFLYQFITEMYLGSSECFLSLILVATEMILMGNCSNVVSLINGGYKTRSSILYLVFRGFVRSHACAQWLFVG